MSLYDMYFSKTNKNHMFTIVTDLVLKETGTDINSDSDYIDLYRFKYSLVFDRSSVDDLVDMNKELIDEIVPLYINDIKSKYKSKNVKLIDPSGNLPIAIKKPHNIVDTLTESLKEYNQIYINSGERVGDSLNRFNYTIQLKDKIKLLHVKEITLPEENNILFENPTICIEIKNTSESFTTFCSFTKTVTLKNKNYNIYHPSKILEIPLGDSILSIKILTNMMEEISDKSDKFKINKLKNISYQSEDYLCLSVTNNECNQDELIGIYCDNDLVKTAMITKIQDNFILIKNVTIDSKKGGDYYFLRLNLQNNLIINSMVE